MTMHHWHRPKPWGDRSAFDALISELKITADARDRRRRRAATRRATTSMMKSLAEATAELKAAMPQQSMMPLIIAKRQRSGCGTIMLKAMTALNDGGLNAGARGHLMLSLGRVDPERVRQAKRNALAQLKELQNDLARGLSQGQAATLVREDRALLAASTSDAESEQLAAELASLAASIGEA
jgi:hypothetical protein